MKRIFLVILFVAIFFAPAGFSYAVTKVSTPVKKIKILIVPGHDDEVWGAQYGNIKEADMNLNLSMRIYEILKKDKRFEVHITRKSGVYTKEFQDYFTNYKDEIVAFKEDAKAKRLNEISDGKFMTKENVPHNSASEDTAIKLYGINKWANENKMDMVLHVHFNDYVRENKWEDGKYKGFAIYMPEGQMVNSKESTNLAKKIFKELKKRYNTSTYEEEIGGLVPDQSLIALGSNGTLVSSVRSVLVEYGYIYRFKTRKIRTTEYTKMANLTTVGIKNYFFPPKVK